MDDDTSNGSPASYESLQTLLLSLQDVTVFLNELAVLAATLVPGVSCGITTGFGANALTVASSDPRAAQLDETQYRTGVGPCLQTLRIGEIVLSADTATEARWPDYTVTARQQGLRSSLSLPMRTGDTTIAAMNLYSFESADAFDPAIRGRYEVFAAQAAAALRLATRQERDTALLTQLEAALNSRTVIDQALGIIMMQRRCPANEAFDLLRRQSQNSHRKLREIAADLVADISGAPPQPGRPFSTG